MIGILQRYIGRELAKAFLLTAIGLTLLFSLCGGVLNMLQAEVLSALEVLRLLGIIMPVAMTFTLPIAALFACAIVYGRFAMDNEFDACKASGINIYRLLKPAVLLSIFTAVVTFVSGSFVLPYYFRTLENMIRADVDKVVIGGLKTRKHFRRGNYVVFADYVGEATGKGDKRLVVVEDAAFLVFEGENLAQVGTADELQMNFSKDAETGHPVISAEMIHARLFDLTRPAFYEEERQPFNPFQISQRVLLKPKWLDVRELLYYQEHPTELQTVEENLRNVRRLICNSLFYKNALEQLTTGDKTLVLSDEAHTYRIQAQHVRQDERDLTLRLRNVKVESIIGDQRRHYEAKVASFRIDNSFVQDGRDVVRFTMEDQVRWYDESDPDQIVSLDRHDLPAVFMPAEFREKAASVSNVQLLGDDWGTEQELTPMGLGEVVEDARVATRSDLGYLLREIASVLHSRTAFSASVLVTLVLAAALGIIFRGGQLMTAFVIAFVPGLFIVVMNIMGRQVAERPETHVIGLVVIWAAIGVVGIADVVVLKRYLRR